MKISITPKGVDFFDRTLVANISNEIVKPEDNIWESQHDFAIYTQNHIIFISLGEDTLYSIAFVQEKVVYGPYTSIEEMCSLHLFGIYDGLITFMKKSILFSDNSSYLKIDNFEYFGHTTHCTGSPSGIARKIAYNIRKLYDSFEYEFSPKTMISDSTVITFLNKLHNMFSGSNFPESIKKNRFESIVKVYKNSVKSLNRDNKVAIIMNTGKSRHAVVTVPDVIYQGQYIFSSNSDEGLDLIEKLVTNAETVTISNAVEVEQLEIDFGIKEKVNTVQLIAQKMFNNLIAVVAFEKELCFIIEDNNALFCIRRTLPSNEFVVEPFANFTMNGLNVTNSGIKLMINSSEEPLLGNVTIKIQEKTYQIDTFLNRCFTEDNNIYCLEFLEDSTKYNLIGEL